jgi:small neutral amino acid transporter SnatA (MarC family)
VLFKASIISFITFSLFALAGEAFLVRILGVRTEAMRVFGGIIFLIVGYNYVTKGYRATVVLRGTLEELPSAIALPFMIGAGTITQAILLGKQHSVAIAVFVIAISVGATFGIVLGFKLAHDKLRGPREAVFDRYVNILSRINGLLIGAISTEMIVSGLHELWAKTQP